MKVTYLYIAMAFVLACMWACTEDAPESGMANAEASRIYLSAGVDEVRSSRAAYYPTDASGNPLSVPTDNHPLNVSVWASTTQGVFADNGLTGYTGEVAIHSNAHFKNGDPQLFGDGDIIYPQNKNVYFVGLHPQGSSWVPSADHTKATFTFTGKEDVMFAPYISGVYGTGKNIKSFEFHHLLTWLRIEMAADKSKESIFDREEVSKAWGNIVSMTISSQNQVIVDLSKEDFSANDITFGETTEIFPFYQKGTDNVYPPDDSSIPTGTQGGEEVAYVMCAPVQCLEKRYDEDGNEVDPSEYIISIKTENRDLEIPIDLKDENGNPLNGVSTMGKQFTVLLNFKLGNVIGVSAGISLSAETEWYTHGTGTGELTESLFESNSSN